MNKIMLDYNLRIYITIWCIGSLLVTCYQIVNFVLKYIHNDMPLEVTLRQVISVIAGIILSWITIILLVIYEYKSSK